MTMYGGVLKGGVLKRRVAALAALALLAGSAGAAGPEALDNALRGRAPEIVKRLHQSGYKDVGVLKFLVARGDGKLSDNVGLLNRSVANRLEVALVLSLDDDDTLGVITRASDAVVASGNKRASHLNPKRRHEFFKIGPTYFRLAWGDDEQVRPDAFLTGEVRL